MPTGSTFEKDEKVEILFSSFAGHSRYTHLIASVYTLAENITTWQYVTEGFMEETRGSWTFPELVNKGLSHEDVCHAASVERKHYDLQSNRSSSQEGSSLRCYNCNRPEHFSRDWYVLEREVTNSDRSNSTDEDTGNGNQCGNIQLGSRKNISVLSQRSKNNSVVSMNDT